MAKITTTYRLLVVLLLICIGTETVYSYSLEENITEQEQQDSDSEEEVITAAQPEAVIPATTFHVVKWLYVADLFSVETSQYQAEYIEELNLVLSYFEALFETTIQVNAP